MTFRESRYVAARLRGLTKTAAALECGFSPSVANCAGSIVETDEIRAEVARLQAELVANTLEVGLIDAKEIHEYLTDALRADMRDIRNEDGSFKPQSEWPEIWGRMMEAGDCEVETESVSAANEDGSVITNNVVRKVKIKTASRVKLLELAMKHKGVNALAQVDEKPANVTINVVYQTAKPAIADNIRVISIDKPADDV